MAAAHPYEAVLHCNKNQPNKLINLGNKVITNMTDNATIYPDPDPAITDPDPDVSTLTTEVAKLVSLQGNASHGGAEGYADRDAQAELVFGLFKTELLYVNSVGKGDKDALIKSGFDVNHQPEPTHVPGQVAIKHNEQGPVEHSQKFSIVEMGPHLTYHVEITTDPSPAGHWDDAEFANGKSGTITNSKEIVIVHLVRGTEYWVRICAINTAGAGEWSVLIPFIAQ